MRFKESVRCEQCGCAVDMSPERAERLGEMCVQVVCSGCRIDEYRREERAYLSDQHGGNYR